MEAIVLVLFALLVLSLFLYKRFKSCILVFKGKKFIVSFGDRNCKVFHFDGIKGNYCRDEMDNWSPENKFNLAEWAWADKFNMRFFVNRFAQLYLKIFIGRLYAVIVFVYLCVVYSLTFLDDKLQKNLNLFLIFWLGLLLSIIFKEFILWKRLAN